MSGAKLKPKSVDDAKPRGAGESRQKKASAVEAAPEADGHAAPEAGAQDAPEVDGHAAPPPDAVEPDPELTPKEAEQARKRYLLRRFWISARGYWSRRGDRLAWPFTIGVLLLICTNIGFQ